jgi:uncharacterized membrane protein YobD (UPF0266 family)
MFSQYFALISIYIIENSLTTSSFISAARCSNLIIQMTQFFLSFFRTIQLGLKNSTFFFSFHCDMRENFSANIFLLLRSAGKTHTLL